MPSSRTVVSLVLAALLAAAWMGLRWPLPVWMLSDNDWLHQLGGANQILHGEHPFIDWHTDYGPFRYYPSALAQWLLGERTLAELLLVTAAYTVAYTVLFHLLWVASGRRAIAAVLLVLALILAPRLFKYYVMLGPVACLWVAWRYIARPSLPTLTLLAATVVVTGLFRADFGAFTGLAAVVAIASGPQPRTVRARTLARLLGLVLLFVSPWFIWLAARGGLESYLVDTLLIGPGHASAMSLPFPRFAASAPLLSPSNAVFFLFLCYYALPPIAAAVALWPGLCAAVERRRILTAAALAQAVLLHAAHRSDYSHLLQAIPVCFVLLAWLVGRALAHRSAAARPSRFLTGAATAALALALGVSLFAGMRVGGWPSMHAGKGLAAVRVHAMRRGELMRELAANNPGEPRVHAIQYVRRCTADSDRIVALPPWTGLYYFADRMFGGAQPNWSPGFFSAEADQRRWIDSVRQQNVQLVLGDFSRVLDGRSDRRFDTYSALVTDYVATHYAPIGSFGPIVVRALLVPDSPPPARADGPPHCARESGG